MRQAGGRGVAPRWRPIQVRSAEPLRLVSTPDCQVFTSEESFRTALGVSTWSPGVDWPREIALVVERGECPTGGYGVAFSGLALEGGPGARALRATVAFTDPSPSDFVTLAITYPRAVAAVRRRALRGVSSVVFVDEAGRVRKIVEVNL